MFNLIDLIQIKTSRPREEVENILTSLTTVLTEYLEKGSTIYWPGLCRLTFKKKAATKKQASLWKEYPYLAEGDKLRVIPENNLVDIKVTGPIAKIKPKRDEPNE